MSEIQENRKGRSKHVGNIPSLLLDNNENQIVFNSLGHGCTTLSTAVVQLYTADAPACDRWNKRCCGVVCFIKDNRQRSYYIRIYNLMQSTMVWEQELYHHFRYKTPCLYFHTFEAEESQAGLNFASEDEAFRFKEAVEQKLVERHLRAIEKRKNSQTSREKIEVQETSPPPPEKLDDTVHNTNIPIKHQNSLEGKKITKEKKEKKKSSKSSKEKKKKGLCKADISGPQLDSFQHVSRVGWDPEKGIVMENLDPAMKNVFKSLGMDENNHEDVDADTVEFIYDFVDTYGGVDAVKAELASRPPSVISLALAPKSNKTGRKQILKSSAKKGLPPVLEERKQKPSSPVKSIGSLKSPPPAAPPRERTQKQSAGIPTPPPPPPAPSAPPPPPIGAPSGGQTLRSTSTTDKSGSDGRNELLSAIRSGKTLKSPVTTFGHKWLSHVSRFPHFDVKDKMSGVARGADFEAECHVKEPNGQVDSIEDRQENSSIAENPGGIMGLLAKALDGRSAQIHGSDDESDEESEDSDWD